MKRALPLLLLGLALPAPAEAYVRTKTANGTPLKWANECIQMQVHNEGLPTPLVPELVLKATTAAATSWGRPTFTCTELRLTVTPTAEGNGPVGNDGVNRVVFRTKRWCRDEDDPSATCYDPAMLALTTLTALPDGTIIDADIEVNAANHKWDDIAASGSGARDLQSALTHEFGHLLGLAHTCWDGEGARPTDHAGKLVVNCSGAGSAVRTTIMYPSNTANMTVRRVLAADDAKAVCQVYGSNADTPACLSPRDGGAPDVLVGAEVPSSPPSGGCALAGPTSGTSDASCGLLALLAGLAAKLSTARRKGR